MQMIDLMKRLAELDAKNPNIVSEIDQRTAMNAYAQMSAGGNDAKGRTGMAGDQSDKLKARMDKRWGPNSTTIELVPGKFYVVSGGRFGGAHAVSIGFDDEGEAEAEKAEYSQGGQEDAVVAQWTGKGWDFDYMMEKDIAEELKGEMHPDAHKVLQHIKPEHHKTYTPYLKKGIYKGNYRDRADVLSAAEKAGHAKETVEEALKECGMMGGMSSQPHNPASINMTAATGEELSAMLKDIMTLAGRPMQEPMGSEEPIGGADGVAVVDVEPSPEVGATDEPSIMRSMIDKLNPADGEADGEQSADDDEEKVDEYNNSPNPTTAGLDAAVPSGNDLHKEKSQYPAAQRGDNPMAVTYESLMAEYREFVAEDSALADPNEADAPEEFELFADPYHTDYWGRGAAKIDPGDQVMIVANELRKDPNEVAQTIVKFARDNPNHGDLTDSQVERAVKDLVPMLGKFSPRRELPVRGGIGQAGGIDEDSSSIESLKDFFRNLRNDVERGLNVMDTFHTKADQLPFQGKRLRQIMQYLRDQSAEADAAQDDPEEMKSIMLAAIDKVEAALGIKPDATFESQDILRLAGLR